MPAGALVSSWKRVFDALYADPIPPSEGPDFRGWTDPATGAPFRREEMDEWMSATVSRIGALRPRRVLEIGAGTGNLALALGPSVESYVATDLSELAVEALQGRAARAGLGHVVALQLEAAEAIGSSPDDYDTIVLNSVCQYFPDAGYARDVIARACDAVGARGHVFVGDVRNAALVALEHAVIEIGRSGDNATPDGVARRLRRDQELVLPPSFFRGVASSLAGRSAVPLLKPVSCDNVLTTFRYDVVISGSTEDEPPEPRVVPWTTTLTAERLDEIGGEPIRITHVPNTRISDRARALAAEVEHPTSDTAPAVDAATGIDPVDWQRAATRRGWQTYPVWDEDARDGSYCLIVVPTGDDGFDSTGIVRQTLRSHTPPTSDPSG